MFFKHQFPVEVESQISPGLLGFQWCGTGIWSKAQIDGRVVIVILAEEVHDFGLVVFQDKAQFVSDFRYNSIGMSKFLEVFTPSLWLDDERTIVHV